MRSHVMAAVAAVVVVLALARLLPHEDAYLWLMYIVVLGVWRIADEAWSAR